MYTRAEPPDYDEIIDLGNYVFSHAHGPTDFPGLLPKLYRRENFMEGIHYLAREGGRIRAVVGAYPLSLRVLDTDLPFRGIGMVSVHPYARSRGYMRALMNMALADMRRDGVVAGCLGGLRQRYEYFGFSPAGTRILYECRVSNIRHSLGRGQRRPGPALSIRQIRAGDPDLGAIHGLHQAKAARFGRDREKLFSILSSWKNRTFVLQSGGDFAGYLVYDEAGRSVPEINLTEPGRAAEALECFFAHLGKNADRDQVEVCVQPWERAKLEAFAAFAEDCRIGTAYSFAVFKWRPLVSALLNLRAATDSLPDGEALFRIVPEGEAPEAGGPEAGGPEGDSPGEEFRISVRQGRAQVCPAGGAGAIVLNRLEAARLFFSPLSPWAAPQLRDNSFLRGVLPLPLFFESPDGV
jgi:predicted N-acetyltransferase YhbS